MAKNKKKTKITPGGKPSESFEEGKSSPSSPPVISKRGWKIMGLGALVVAIGFFVLSLTDPMGQNWASNLSPFLLLGGYALIGFGIIAKDPSS